MKYLLALPIAALSLVASFSPACATPLPFGAASAYNVVALTGNIYTQSDIGGRAAADGSINAPQVALNGIPNDTYGNSSLFSFVADGGNAAQNPTHVTGNAYSAGSTPGQFLFQPSGSGTLTNSGASPINFSQLASSIDAESLALATLASTGTAVLNNNDLTLTGLSSSLNVFNITAAQLAATGDAIMINAPAGSTIIINVSGGSGGSVQVPKLFYNGNQTSGDSAADDDILFNFDQAQSTVNFNGQFSASVLAPLATVTGNSQFDGTLIAGAVNFDGEIHNVEFDGNIPLTSTPGPTPEPSSFVLLATGAAGMLGAIRRRLR